MGVDVYDEMTRPYLVKAGSRWWSVQELDMKRRVIYICQGNISRRENIQKLAEELTGHITIISVEHPVLSHPPKLLHFHLRKKGLCALIENAAEITLMTLSKAVRNPCMVPVHTESANHVCELNTVRAVYVSCFTKIPILRTLYNLFYFQMKKHKLVERSLQKKRSTFQNRIFCISTIL